MVHDNLKLAGIVKNGTHSSFGAQPCDYLWRLIVPRMVSVRK